MYGLMLFFSCFWVFGLQAMIPIGYALWGYMLFQDVSNVKRVLDNWGTLDGSRFTPGQWMLESILLWNLGTLFNVNFLWLLTFIPVVGPIVNAIYIFIAMIFVFG